MNKKVTYINSFIILLLSVLVISCSSKVEYNGIGFNILGQVTKSFTITAKKEGSIIDTSDEVINIGEKVSLFFKNNNNNIAATWRLEGGTGNLIIKSNGINAEFIPTTQGNVTIYASYGDITKHINIEINEVQYPSNITLASTISPMNSTPIVSWSDFHASSVEASIYRSSDNLLIKDWTIITKDSSIGPVSLDEFENYYMLIRAKDEIGNTSTSFKTPTWLSSEAISSQTYIRAEVSLIKDIDYARNKFWIIPNGASLNNNSYVKTSTSLSNTFTNEVLLRFPQALLSHNDEIYIFDQEKFYRGDGISVNNTTGDSYMSSSPSIGEGYIYTGASTGTNQGNRYYILDLTSFSLKTDIRDFVSGNGRGASIRSFNNRLFFSGQTHNNSGNLMHVHTGNTSNQETVSTLTQVDIGHYADDNNFEETVLEKSGDNIMIAAVRHHNKYSYTQDGISWSPKYFGATERIRAVISDSIGFLIFIQNSSDGSEYIYRLSKDDPDNPTIIYHLTQFGSLYKVKIINNDIYIVGGNLTGNGYIEVVSNLLNRPIGI